MKKVKVTTLDELGEGSLKTFEVEGNHILLANVHGMVYGIGAICTHEEWDLSEGKLEGETVVCAGHGAVWDLRTGKAQFRRPLPPEPVYRVVVEGGDVYVELD
ncbi:MAG: Rieske 2Fe-2S domain-containing protein [Nitrososphaerota archaeon]